jgi:DUF4097 and DUF4098 domain-containing protein YvlB
MRGMKFTVFGGALLTAGLAAAGCEVRVDSQAQIVREDKRFTVEGTAILHVATFDGSIQIQSWDRPDVLVEIEKRGPTKESVDSLEVKTEQHGDTIELEVKRPRRESLVGFGFHRSPTARLIVSVPRRVDVRARSGDGSIRIERVTGRIELHTGDGSIRATDVGGELTMSTGDGSVTVDGAEGRLDLQTGDGGVNVAGKITSLRAHTGDGSIVFRAQPGTSMTDDWEITTGDGGVSLYLPADFGAELDAHTGDGAIRNDLEIKTASGGEVSRRTVRGVLGAGGKRMRVRTGDGSIYLRQND